MSSAKPDPSISPRSFANPRAHARLDHALGERERDIYFSSRKKCRYRYRESVAVVVGDFFLRLVRRRSSTRAGN